MTTEQFAQLQKAFNTQLGSDTYSKVSMLSPSEVEQILKDTNTKNQTDATTSATDWISKLTSNLPAPYQEYAKLNTQALGQYQQAIAPQEEEARKASQQYQNIVQKGPMFELAMRPELAKISPTFMGANRKDLDAKLTAEGITDPFVKQSMIDSYLQYADSAMTMSLSALGQLYDSAVIASKTVAEDKQSAYEKVADIYKEAYQTTIMANKDWLDSKINPKTENGLSEDFNDDLSAISDFSNRDEVLTFLNNKKTAFINKYGEDKYKELLTEVDRVFPVSTSPTSSGKGVYGWVEGQVEEMKSFFGNLFGG